MVAIIKRLAHAHHHHIGYFAGATIGRAGCPPILQIVARGYHLACNFSRREIAHQFLCAGVAKAAGQGAADLAGNA